MNPFKYGQVVSKEDFCPRPAVLKDVLNFIKSGQNACIQGERRVGKTSLIYEAVQSFKRKRLVYIDLLEIKTSDDLCKRIIKSLISLEQRSGFLEKALKSLAHLKPIVSIDPLTGLPSVSVDAGIHLKPESIDSLLDMIAAMHKRRNLIIVFDEFQDILNLKDSKESLAILRSKIQFHSKIPYIFAGSIRNKMHEIFNHPDSAFFKSAITVQIGPLDRNEFCLFLKKKFSSGKRSILSSTLEKVFEIANNIPGDIQQLCGALWEITTMREKIGPDKIPDALKLIYTRESKGYEAVLVQITGQQLRCLMGLARAGGKSPQSISFLKTSGISLTASVKKALDRLEKLKIIYRHQDEYKFVNPFFKSWLLFKGF